MSQTYKPSYDTKQKIKRDRKDFENVQFDFYLISTFEGLKNINLGKH